jgi:hypothetical protein
MWLTLLVCLIRKPKGSKEQMEINSKQLTRSEELNYWLDQSLEEICLM